MKSISFHTLGCRLNQSETAVIQNSFKAKGYRVVHGFNPADIAVINTCTVTQRPEADTRKLIHRVLRINPETRIALIGCQSQIHKENLISHKNIRWVVGNDRKMDLAEIFDRHPSDEHPLVMAGAMGREPFTVPFTGTDPRHTRANLKIQDGCDFFCAFCAIPYARGRSRSRVFEDIIKEARALCRAGHKEIVITGINIGMYRFQDKNITDVIKALEDIPDLRRIRMSSIELTTIPHEILEIMGRPSKLCRHLHIPLQTADDGLLKAMGRKYRVYEFFDFLHQALDAVPGICLGTDVMVGFPGETHEIFSAVYEKLRLSPFHYFHVFSYSQRGSAQSRHLKPNVPERDLGPRSVLLRALSREKRKQFFLSHLGTRQKILVEQQKHGLSSGLTDNFIRVGILSPENLANRVIDVKLTSLGEQCVIGERV